MGCELLYGISALEGIFGIWHVSTVRYPMCCPAILYPCYGGPICCPGGSNETVSKELLFSPSETPTLHEEVFILSHLCADLFKPFKALKPYHMMKRTVFGLLMSPVWGGEAPPEWHPDSDNNEALKPEKALKPENST